MVGRSVSSALVVACVLCGVAADVRRLDSCAAQDACMSWTISPASETCADLGADVGFGHSRVQMWKACVTIHEESASYPACPKAVIRSTCPQEGCPSKNRVPAFVKGGGCGKAHLLPYEECHYGRPGETLKFFVQHGETCAVPTTDLASAATHTPPTIGATMCVATKHCGPNPTPADSCRAAAAVAGKVDCVHAITLPASCGGEGGEVELIPRADEPLALGLSESLERSSPPPALPSSLLAVAGAAGVATAALVGAISYRRLAERRTPYEARALAESLEE